jgi:putative transposase
MPIKRKSTRLASENYVGKRVYFITVCCDQRQRYLADPSTANQALSILVDVARKHRFLLHAYCAMPGHIHFLLHAVELDSNLLRLMKEFKSRTAFLFKKNTGRQLWEMSYYDHILRHGHAIEAVASYIWNIRFARISANCRKNNYFRVLNPLSE